MIHKMIYNPFFMLKWFNKYCTVYQNPFLLLLNVNDNVLHKVKYIANKTPQHPSHIANL